MNIALVTAAGVGSRMNCDIPKQFLTVDDKPIIIYTLEALQKNANIDAIIVACLGGWEQVLLSHIKFHSLTKVKWVVEGGETGQESITKCLDELRAHVKDDDLVTVHDGNRPLIDDFVLNESIRVCRTYGNAVACIPCVEAILGIERNMDVLRSSRMVDRETLVRTQTPHTFPFAVLDDAYREIAKIDNAAVAPCTVMIALGKELHLSAGSELNIKITTANDLRMFRALLKQKEEAHQ